MQHARRGPVGQSVSRHWRTGAAALGMVVTAIGCRMDDTVAGPAAQSQTPKLAVVRAAVPGKYIVTLTNGAVGVSEIATKLLKSNGNVTREYGKALRGFSADMSAETAAELASDPMVASVEPDQIVKAHGIQSPAPWALDRVDQRAMPLNSSYSYANGGEGVNVYIFDTGIRTTHVQFAGRASNVFSAFADGFQTVDCNGHGTYVAGLVGSQNYGVAKGANLRSVRVLDCAAVGTTSSVIAGLEWLTANRLLPAVANLSLGLPYSAALNQAVNNAIAAGITVVVSAGNDGGDACQYSPASVGGALTVGSSTQLDAMASWSNRGTCVDLFAPGTNVFSTYSQDDAAVTVTTGSSASAPHVAGAAAIYLAANPSASPAAVAAAVVNSATTGVLTGLDSASPNRLVYTNVTGGAEPPPPPPPTDNPPKAVLSFSCRKTACTLDASKSTDDNGIVRYDWSYGDGSTGSTTTATSAHTYATAKDYTASVKVTDGSGQSATASVLIRLKGR